jgi:hypothetical protein
MKTLAFIILAIVFGIITPVHAETGQELQLKKEGTDGPSLQETQKYIKEKMESINDVAGFPSALGYFTGSFRQVIEFDNCNIKIYIERTFDPDHDIHKDVSKETECDMSTANLYSSNDRIKEIDGDATCFSKLKYKEIERGILLDGFSNTITINTSDYKFSFDLSKSNHTLNKKLYKAFSRLVDLCKHIKPKRDIKNKSELF